MPGGFDWLDPAAQPPILSAPSNTGGTPFNVLFVLELGGVDIHNYPVGTGFSGVYNQETGNYLLRPSSNSRTPQQIKEGWVGRTGGHIDVQSELYSLGLATDYDKDIGFAVVYEDNHTLVVTFRSGGINVRLLGDYYPPQEIQDEITQIIRLDVPGMVIKTMDRYPK